MHRALTDMCRNPVYGLILKSFQRFHEPLATAYFRQAEKRAAARVFYKRLRDAVAAEDAALAGRVMSASMQQTRRDWTSRTTD